MFTSMLRITVTTLAVFAVLLITGAAARAASPPTLTQSIAIAEAAWPEWPINPCQGRIVIEWYDSGDMVAGQYESETCTVVLNPSIRNDPGYVCDTIVHEVGHMAGHKHSEGGIMGDEQWPACHPRIPARTVLRDAIHDLLPGKHWLVACTPSARKMVCAASRRGSYTRMFRASIRGGEFREAMFVRYRGISK